MLKTAGAERRRVVRHDAIVPMLMPQLAHELINALRLRGRGGPSPSHPLPSPPRRNKPPPGLIASSIQLRQWTYQ
jgi:hypothetical protein